MAEFLVNSGSMRAHLEADVFARWTSVRTYVLRPQPVRRLAADGVMHGFQMPEAELVNPTKAVAGTVLGTDGQPYLAGATVLLFRDTDNKFIAATTSDTTAGRYSFPRNTFDPGTYYVVAFSLDRVTPLQAVTVTGLRAA